MLCGSWRLAEGFWQSTAARLALRRAGQFRYVSQPFTGSDLLIVRARTAENTSPPTAIPIAVRNTVQEMGSELLSLQATAGSQSRLSLGASDFDGDPLTYELVEAPSKGTVELVSGDALYTAVGRRFRSRRVLGAGIRSGELLRGRACAGVD